MSAIWGCVDFCGEYLDEGLCAAMQQPLGAYKVDRIVGKVFRNALMGCGVQYIFGNSVNEPLPILDEERGILFTADCVMDNRDDLVKLLAPERPTPPDGELLYLAWLRWGNACHNHILGSYAFAVYDYRRNVLTLAVDYRATRCMYWCRRDTRVYFGTLLHSVVDVLHPKPELNLKWVADYLTLPFIMVGTDTCATPFCTVQRMHPAVFMEFSTREERVTCHWEPLKLPKLKLEDDDAYRRHFLALMDKVAGDIAARDAQAGVYLSGGMDSGAIAAAAARVLARHGRALHTYTSVPLPDYKAVRNRHVAEDESDEVRQLCAIYPNIRPYFCALENLDAFSIFPGIIDRHEIPLKSAANITWIYAIGAGARRDGCKIMLNGQMGNHTISYGDKYLELFRLIAGNHFIRAMRALNAAGKRLGVSRKRLLRTLLAHSDFSRHPANTPATESEVLDNAYVAPELARKQGSLERVRQMPGLREGKSFTRKYNRFDGLLDPLPAVLVGESNTKTGLTNGIVVRDMSADRRIVEFCCTAPSECFIKDGVDRRLIREYMGPMLPPAITRNISRVGIQSADWVARLARRWPEIRDMLERAAENLSAKGAVNAPKLLEDLTLFPEGYGDKDDLKKLLPMCGIYALDYFLRRNCPEW